ncbi:hypothetical protein BATDEDRAFT_16153 [Batrachochytrium dendrobatidis JAM81]|uniref:Sugar transporter SWEET1 n=2 Tax=Batrachochytrium dendrobatidis TaxID=109871 RepID=F4NY39_BATDJ|nr:uncharacterized protein BATDEDRAFT_16153 [Batrachochytrium dendrobatidis JAM81]EGF81946.1 hypothetical protein BATDEDRAFT_16153 [Batrachochytrium dendrobatidis JAM81]KAJ8324388.1 hypothetical protein O5D80_006648 [Batrachochytrium dendrobatidis]KAK5670640.1 hypothetical protein QVD99_002420 [Batrachochytrium dendrobatidis]OAJ40698.1 hypothetical protein BDEG_24403 [Batrachochytrium dendrobatidis JEL423]|eukprot:XP_006677187.1 hypothetical protein BATDEDRAFT_16153 [Batrachochytrium dendrobatidis JAM81]
MSAIVMNHVLPALGVAFAISIYLSPFTHVWKSLKNKEASLVNTMPYPWIIANCLGWIVYGCHTGDYYVFVANIVGYHLGLFYTLSSLHYGSDKFRTTAAVIVLGSSFLVLTSAFVVFAILRQAQPSKTVLGSVCVFILVIFYASPLSDLASVIRSRDASSINPILGFCSLLNGALWTGYGFAISDPFIWAPNVVGVVLSIVQLFLCFLFRGNKSTVNSQGTLPTSKALEAEYHHST